MQVFSIGRVDSSGAEWADWMQDSATGTYSSQWMVVDYNRFHPGEPLTDGLLYVVEQVPGLSHAQELVA